jgi:hypothetical protein
MYGLQVLGVMHVKISKTQNRICMGLAVAGLAVLIAIFFYQVAYGTNESDYRYGYKYGLLGYHQRSISHICAIEENTYTPECENGLNLGSTFIPHIDNETACQHFQYH